MLKSLVNVLSSSSLMLWDSKPSVKVEKLLNDSRGMRKYLIDYNDCLMTTQKLQLNNETDMDLSMLIKASQMCSMSTPNSPKFFKSYKSTSHLNRNLRKRSRRTPASSLNKSLPNPSQCNDFNSTKCLSSNRSSSGYLTDC